MDLLKDLNAEQKHAVTHGDGPMLIVAGAGTGKTTVITKRIAHLIEQGLAKPEEILALTFTDKAAGEMEERVDRLLPYGYVELWISTFHAFCERILRKSAIDVGLPNDFKLLNTTDAWLLVHSNLDKFNLDYYRPLGNPTKFIHALLKHFSRAKDECIKAEEYLEYAQNPALNSDVADNPHLNPPPLGGGGEEGEEISDQKRLAEVANAYHVYQNLLLEKNAFDFGDLINYALKLFKERPKVLNEYRKQFKYILVDEFQDTNLAQYELIKMLAAPINNLTVVGDDDQSVYKFRGASISNILAFKKDFPESQEIFLTQNYRSRQNLLDFSYKFIQLNNPNRLEYQLVEKANPHLNPPPLGGGGEEGERSLSKRLISQSKDQGIIEHIYTKTHFDEARATVDRIIELKESGEIATSRFSGIRNDEQGGEIATSATGGLAMTEPVTWNDFAILVRANDHADLFIRELADRGVPYQFFASRGLYSKPIILDILSYLRLLDNYHESTAMYRVLNFPVWQLADATKMELLHYASKKAISLHAAIRQAAVLNLPPTELVELQKMLALIDKHTALARASKATRIIFAFLNDTEYLKWLTDVEDRNRLDSINYLNILWKKVQNFETQTPQPTARHFLQLIDMEIEAGEEGSLPTSPDEGPETVKLMTIHASKGLEFKYVFLVNLVDQRFPTRERKEAIELPDALVKEIKPEGDVHVQEERRLFYVACTRAKDGLFLTSAEDYGGARARKPSRFLYESGIMNKELRIRNKELGTDPHLNPPPLGGGGNTMPHLNPPPLGGGGRRGSEAAQTMVESIKYELPAKLSFTQVKAFETCPLQYKYMHLLKIPTAGRGTFSFGKSIHGTLQKFFQMYKDRALVQQGSLLDPHLNPPPRRGGGNTIPHHNPPPYEGGGGSLLSREEGRRGIGSVLTVDELIILYQTSFIDDWFDDEKQKQDYFEKGRKVLKSFYNSVAETAPDIFGLEIPFTFKIADKPFKGAIDRVDRLPDGSLEIIDYKTGKSKDLESVDKEQLLIYQLAAKELFREPVSQLTFWYVEDGKKASFLGSEEALEKLRNRIAGTIDEMQKSTFPATPGEFTCKFCDFKDICEFRVI